MQDGLNGAPTASNVQNQGELNPEGILVAEFQYIAQTAFQSNEDRSKVTTLYLASTGTLVAAIFSTQIEKLNDPQTYWAFAALFIVLSTSALLSVLQLVQLRRAWFESAYAMNQIKNYYASRLPAANLADAFHWNIETLPTKAKYRSIAALLVIQVAVLGGVNLGAAIIFFGLGFDLNRWWWKTALFIGIGFCICLVMLYQRLVRR